MRADWETASLSELCARLIDGDWIETKDQGGSDYRLLQVSNIGVGEFRETGNFRWITEGTFKKLKCSAINVGDILIARMPEPTGRAWFVDTLPWPAVTAVDVAIATPNRDTDGRYLAYYLNSPQNLAAVAAASTGTTRLRIARRVLAELSIQKPSLGTQRKIAGILAAYDELIRNNLRRIEILEEMAQAIYREWFVNFRYPGHEADQLVDWPHGEGHPHGWSMEPFGRVATAVRSHVDPSKHASSDFVHYSFAAFDSGGVPALEKGGNLRSGKLAVNQPSVLFAKLNPRIPRVWLVDPPSDVPAIASSEFLILVPTSDVPLVFIYTLLSDPAFASRVASMSVGTSTSHQRLKQSDLESMEIVVPPRHLLHRFDETVGPMLRLVRMLVDANANLRATRDLLLPRLVSGEIDVSDLDIDTSWLTP